MRLLNLVVLILLVSGCAAVSNGVKSGTQAMASQSSATNLKHTECHETVPGHIQCDEF